MWAALRIQQWTTSVCEWELRIETKVPHSQCMNPMISICINFNARFQIQSSAAKLQQRFVISLLP